MEVDEASRRHRQVPDHDAVDGLAVGGVEAIGMERKARHVLTQTYGEHAVAKNVRRVVPLDDVVSAFFMSLSPSISPLTAGAERARRSSFISALLF
jgi:hypothetical protein